MYENYHYALDFVTDEELDIVANDIMLLCQGYVDDDLINVFFGEE